MAIPTDGYGATTLTVAMDIGEIMSTITIKVQLPGEFPEGSAQTVVDSVMAGFAAIRGHLATAEPEWWVTSTAYYNGAASVELPPAPPVPSEPAPE